MANIEQEAAGSSDLGKEIGDAGVVGAVVETLSTEVAIEPPAQIVCSDREDVGETGHAQLPQVSSVDSANIARPSVAHVPMGSSNYLGSASSQPKRFSAMNINKKFLEKTSSASGASQTSTTSVSAKAGGPICE
jgi:serine/arginine repetitive matrix protein 2